MAALQVVVLANCVGEIVYVERQEEPCGIPQLTGFGSDLNPLTTGNCFLSQR